MQLTSCLLGPNDFSYYYMPYIVKYIQKCYMTYNISPNNIFAVLFKQTSPKLDL